jgi:hypothetical protein
MTHLEAHDHSHPHEPGHVHAHPARAADVSPAGFSLLRLSAVERVGGAALIAALIWSGVWWALH